MEITLSLYENNPIYPVKVKFTKIPNRGALKGLRIENQLVYFPNFNSAIDWVGCVSKDKTICEVEILKNRA